MAPILWFTATRTTVNSKAKRPAAVLSTTSPSLYCRPASPPPYTAYLIYKNDHGLKMQVSEKVTHSPRLGAHRTSEGAWEFLLWAPHARSVSLYLCDSDEKQPMELCERGYHRAIVANPKPDGRYLYQFDDGRRLPDPASRYQPEGVHGPSQLVDSGSFEWTDQNWKGLSLERSIFYELHVGTFTKEG